MLQQVLDGLREFAMRVVEESAGIRGRCAASGMLILVDLLLLIYTGSMFTS